MAEFRKICYTEADVKCPFFIKEERHTRAIFCEGFEEKSVTATRFSTLGAREKHMGVHCTARYEDCPLYKTICGHKYGED